jgi:hypothetical protein
MCVRRGSSKWSNKQYIKEKCRFLVQNFNGLMIQQVSYVVNIFNIWFFVRERELSIHLKEQSNYGVEIRY